MWISLTNWILAAVKTRLYLFTKLIFSIYCQIYPFTWKFSVYCRTGLAQVLGMGFDSKTQSNVGITMTRITLCIARVFLFLFLNSHIHVNFQKKPPVLGTLILEAVSWRCSMKEVLLKILLSSQENPCAGATFFIAAVGWKPTTLL